MPAATKNSMTWFKAMKSPPFNEDDTEEEEGMECSIMPSIKVDLDGEKEDEGEMTSSSSTKNAGNGAKNSSSKKGKSAAASSSSSKRNNEDDDDDDNNDGDEEETVEGGTKRKRRKTTNASSTSTTATAASPHEGTPVKPTSSVPPSVHHSFEKMRARMCSSPDQERLEGPGRPRKDKNLPKLLEYVPGISKKYGVMPKMMRLQVRLLWVRNCIVVFYFFQFDF